VFDAHLSGLMLAEVDFETPEEMERPLELPHWVIREVSDEIQFTGGALANLTSDQAVELIRRIPQSHH
jgi:CYTH domain-containing protein